MSHGVTANDSARDVRTAVGTPRTPSARCTSGSVRGGAQLMRAADPRARGVKLASCGSVAVGRRVSRSVK